MLNAPQHLATTDGRGWFRADHRVAAGWLDPLVFADDRRGLGWVAADITRQRRESQVTIVVRGDPLTVRVASAQGAALGGAEVQALPCFAPLGWPIIRSTSVLDGAPRVGARFSGRTDAEGVVRFESLPRGEGGEWGPRGGYRLRVVAAGYREATEQIELSTGGSAIDLVLHRDVPIRFTVRVVGPDEVVVTGAKVRVGANEAVTDERGVVRFDDVRVAATEVQYSVAHTDYVDTSGSWPVPVEGDAECTVALELATSFAAEVVDQYGDAVAGASVHVDGHYRTRTDDSGRFELHDLPRTPLRVHIMPPIPDAQWDPTEWSDHALPVAEQPRRFVLTRKDRGVGELHVVVVDMVTGAAAGPEPASLWPIDANGFRSGSGIQPQEVRLGVLRFNSLPAGRYVLLVAGRVEQRLQIKPGQRRKSLRVEIGGAGRIEGELALAPGLSWPETVTVGVGPSSNAASWLQPDGGELLSHEPNGIVHAARLTPSVSIRFELERADPHRPITVTASGGGLFGRAVVQVPARGVARPRVVLKPAGRLVLRFSEPCPWFGLRMHLEPTDGTPPEPPRDLIGLTTRDMRRVVVPAGSYRWRVATFDAVTGEETERASGSCEVEAGGSVDLQIELRE